MDDRGEMVAADQLLGRRQIDLVGPKDEALVRNGDSDLRIALPETQHLRFVHLDAVAEPEVVAVRRYLLRVEGIDADATQPPLLDDLAPGQDHDRSQSAAAPRRFPTGRECAVYWPE